MPNDKYEIREVEFGVIDNIKWVTEPQKKYYCSDLHYKRLLKGLKFTKYKCDADVEIARYIPSISMYNINKPKTFFKKYNLEYTDDDLYTTDYKMGDKIDIKLTTPGIKYMDIKTAYEIAHANDPVISNEELIGALENIKNAGLYHSEVKEIMKMILLTSHLNIDQRLAIAAYFTFTEINEEDLKYIYYIWRVDCKKDLDKISDEYLRNEIKKISKIWNG